VAVLSNSDDTIEAMIKGMTLVTPVASMAALDRLASLLAALGFEPGKRWQDETGPRRSLPGTARES